jgi:hypothetical protein
MMAVEQKLWDAWKAKDAAKIRAMTSKDLSFENIFGDFFSNRADAVKDWTSPRCQVTKVSVSDGVGTLVSPTLGMLNRTGTADGTCDGQKLTSVRVYGTSFFVKDGGSWKLAFSLNCLD